MRDKNRIKPFMAELTKLWELNPDYRFFQLVEVLKGNRDLFNQEDNISLQEIQSQTDTINHNKYYEDNKNEIYENIKDKVLVIFKDEKDKGGNPYIEHLYKVSNKQDSIDGKIIGLLHDILEDTKTSIEELYSWGLTGEIIKQIQLLTRVSSQSYKEYIEILLAKGDLTTLKVKLADVNHNLDTSRVKDISKVQKLIDERYKPTKIKLEKAIQEKEELNKSISDFLLYWDK